MAASSVVAVFRFDRLTRSLSHFLQILATHEIISCTESIDVNTPHGWFSSVLLVLFSEYELRVIRSRTSAALDLRSAGGLRRGGRPPLGYRLLHYDGGRDIQIDQWEGKIVQEVFRMREKGASLSVLSQFLQDNGISLSRQGVSYLLKNQVYCGIVDGSYRPELKLV